MSANMAMRSINLVLIGDEAVGKTCLGLSYTQGFFEHEHVRTVFDHYTTHLSIDDTHVKLGVYDSAGQDMYDSLRHLSYPSTDVFLVCFSLVNRVSFERVTSKWYPEICHHRPGIPFILVGTKLDLRENINAIINPQTVIQHEQGLLLSKNIGAAKYIECSSLIQKGVRNVFEEAVRASLKTSDKNIRTRFCCIL